MPDWFPNILSARALSLVVALIYLGITIYFALRDGTVITELCLKWAVALAFPLACIWFPDEMGDMLGTFPGPGITRTTPGWMVKLGGWVLLLMPAILYLVSFTRANSLLRAQCRNRID